MEITNQKEILNEQMRFYQKLYTSNKNNVNTSDFLEEDKMPKLSENHVRQSINHRGMWYCTK